jgi:predicted RNase H-like HicB family nuclease
MAGKRRTRKSSSKMLFTMKVFKGEDGYYVAYCEELPGVASQGKTLKDVRSNFREALFGYLEAVWDVQTRRTRGPPSVRGKRPVEIEHLALAPVPA